MTATSVLPASANINFTVSAADKVAALIAEEGNPKLNLRVSIRGGGCSGFEYVFTFDEAVEDDDTVIEQKCTDGQSQAKLVVDYMSYPILKNAEIDYVQNLQGEQFVIRNPNAKTTCGCGSSFSLDEDE